MDDLESLDQLIIDAELKIENINVEIMINEVTKIHSAKWLYRIAKAKAYTIIQLKKIKKDRNILDKSKKSDMKHERYLIKLKEGKYFNNEFMLLVKPILGKELYLDLIDQAQIKVTENYNDKGIPAIAHKESNNG